MSGLSPEDIAYLRQRAQGAGYNPDDLVRVMQYESSMRPDVWGGTNNKYFGLFQFGPEERKQFGVDTAHPNARNQIDAGLKFLDARGFKPGMSLLDLYSTVNAGSPGHYKASDGNGTVASHVQAMLGKPLPVNPTIANGVSAPAYAPQPQAKQATDQIAQYLQAQQQPAAPTAGLLSEPTVSPQVAQDNSLNDAFLRQIQDFHNQRHMMSVQGLL